MFIRSSKELALFAINQRKKLGLTQAEVADKVGLGQKTISAFENNPDRVKVATLFMILSALHLDMNLTDKANNDGSGWDQEW